MSNKRRPQGDGTIRKREDGRWEGRVIIGHKNDGMPMYKSVFGKTQKETLKLLHQMIELYRDVDLTEECRMTLGEWMDKWLDEYMMFTVRESTLEGYRRMSNNQVKRFLGDRQLSSLTTADIQKFYNTIKKKGRLTNDRVMGYELSDSVVRKVHMMLHEALETAVRERLLPKNPTKGTAIPKTHYGEKQVFGDAQLEIFREAIKHEEYWGDLFYLEIMMGFRRGEVCGLKWEDVDFRFGTLRVQRSVTYRKGAVCVGETKTHASTRTITMPPSVSTVLEKRKETAVSEWIFPNPQNPEQPISPAAAYRKLKIILKHAGLPLIRFHDLRHTFATHATEGGVDPKTLSGILGHTNASLTLDCYTQVTNEMQKNATAVIGRMAKKLILPKKED